MKAPLQKSIAEILKEHHQNLSCLRSIRVASLCAGLDVCHFALDHILQAWHQLGWPPLPVTFWAAEKDPEKRATLLQRSRSGMSAYQVFGDVHHLKGAKSWDYLSGKFVEPNPADIWLCGSPCVDLSPLNNKQVEFGPGCSGQSSTVLDAVLDLVEDKRPRMLVLENVKRILHKRGCQNGRRGHEMVLARMRDLGYAYSFTILDAADWVPQRRSRAWLVFVLIGCGDPQRILQLARECQPTRVPSLEDIFSVIPCLRVKSKERKPRKTKRDGMLKWPGKTLHFIEAKKLRADRLVACKKGLMSCSDFADLCPREQHLLTVRYAYLQQCRAIDPVHTAVILDISQSVSRVPWAKGQAPCLTSSSKLWLSKPGGLLTAAHYAALQGVPEAAHLNIPEKLLLDMLGNAFCGPIAQAILLSALVVKSERRWPDMDDNKTRYLRLKPTN